MNATDDLQVRLRDWMSATATSAPDAPVRRALESTAQVRQRPGLVVTTGIGTALWPPARWNAARVVLIGLLTVALVGAALSVASRRPDEPRPRPSGPLPSAAVRSVPLKLTLTEMVTFGMLEPFGPDIQGSRVLIADPTLVGLSDGRALILGGSSNRSGSTRSSVASVGIYDPERRGVIATGSMNVAREGATAVSLADGRVLVLGGHQVEGDTGRTVTEAEIFDPQAGRFTVVDPMLTGRDPCHCGVRFQVLVQIHATLMGDGRIFVAGGSMEGLAGTPFADLFDPASQSFERVEIGCDAARGTQTALADGRILVLCLAGAAGASSTTVRIFDPVTSEFTTPAQPAGGSAGLATLLSDGRVLPTGPALTDVAAPAELFDPDTDSWSQVSSAINPSADVAVTLSDGRVAFTDQDPRNAVIFDPSANDFVEGPKIAKLGLLSTVALPDDRILVQEGGNLMVYRFEPGPMTRRTVAVLAVAAVIAACAGGTPAPSGSAPAPPGPSGSALPTITPTSWAGDLAVIDRTVREFHPAPFTIHPESEWKARLADVGTRVESASENEQITLVASLVGLLDTHSGFFAIPGGWHFYDLLPYRFSDGWFVVNAGDPTLIGDELVSIGGVPIEDVVTRLAPLVPHDNPTGLLGNILWQINSVEYLNGAGIVGDVAHPAFVLRARTGGSITVDPPAIPEQQYTLPSPGYLTGRAPEAVQRRAERIWTALDAKRRVFLISVNDYGDMVAAGQAMTAALDARKVDRVVFDMRYLQGGSGDIAIVETIRDDERVNRPGALTVLIGRENYSAATSVAEFFDRETSATFVGEPTPARADNFRCDCHDFQLPHSGFWLTVPTWYDRFNDDRPEITPDVPMALSSADFFAGRDPVLDAAVSGSLPGR